MLQDIQEFRDPQVHKLVRHRALVDGPRDLFGSALPAELMVDYALSDEGLERMGKLQKCNADRSTNVLQAWNRVQLYLPELMTAATQDVVQLSCSHGAMLEVLRHHGHRVMGTQYAPTIWSDDPSRLQNPASMQDHKPDWPYRFVADSIDLPMTLHDTGSGVLPFKDGSFDTVICDRTLGHFAYPEDWIDLLEEFCRISRGTVLVMLDRLSPNLQADAEYRGAFDRFRSAAIRYRENGFACTASFTHWDQVLGFKLTAQ